MRAKIILWAMVLLLSVFTGSVFGGMEGATNTFYGQGAGANITTGGDYNTFTGVSAGSQTTTGARNTFLGAYAGYANTTGFNNIFLGNNVGLSNIDGHSNTSVGLQSSQQNISGSYNTFLGEDAGQNNTTGNYNTYIGTFAGQNATGTGNVFLGFQAGLNETGSNKLYVDNSNISTPLIYGEFDNNKLTVNGNLEVIGPNQGLVRLSNVTTDSTTKVSRMVLHHYSNAQLPVYLFGAASTATDNFVAFGGGNIIGNAATQIDLFTAPNPTTPVGSPRITIKGDGYVGIGTQSPSYPLQMAGGAYSDGGAWINGSSRDYKEKIKGLGLDDALEVLKGLNPVTFSYRATPDETRVGFIAEDVPDLVATKDRKGLSPMDIVSVLTKVVQEQQKTISTLREELNELKEKVR